MHSLKKNKDSFFVIWTYISGFSIVLGLIILLYLISFRNRLYPGIYISGIYLGESKVEDAKASLYQKIPAVENVTLKFEDQSFGITLKEIGFAYDIEKTIQEAHALYRNENLYLNLVKSLSAIFRKNHLVLKLNYDSEILDQKLALVAEEVSKDPIYPTVKLTKGEVIVTKGAPGREINVQRLTDKIQENLSLLKDEEIEIEVIKKDPTLSNEEINTAKKRAKNLLGKTLLLKFEYQTFNYKDQALLDLINPKEGINPEKIKDLVTNISSQVNRSPQDSVFVFEEGRVKEFLPAKDGVNVIKEDLEKQAGEGIEILEKEKSLVYSLEIAVTKSPPKVRTGDVNNLGIRELLGRGSSKFKGSISSRIYNIGLAASKLKGVLVPPGSVFSFNEILGDVSSFTGYKQAYIIKDGRTVLGDGGGVCQVSTTLFRALLNAGLPIVERRAHSYRVSYYEQDSSPGLDATVFAPTTDLKFKNDTPGHLLIQPQFDSKKQTLVFEIYGTNDGRVAKISKPVVSEVIAPPEDLYQDDPTLPAGTIKQVDFKAWGAKVVFNYTVEKEKEVIYKKTFVSNFRPWQAIFLRGTAPI